MLELPESYAMAGDTKPRCPNRPIKPHALCVAARKQRKPIWAEVFTIVPAVKRRSNIFFKKRVQYNASALNCL